MRRIETGLLFTASLLAASISQAGGLWINEFGSPTMGRAGAGSVSSQDGAGAALHSPAAMAKLDGDHIMATAGLIASEIEFDVKTSEVINGTEDGGNAGGVGPGASLFYVRGLNDKWKMGVYAGGWTGAILDYDDDWVGRFQTTEVNLLVLGVMPSLSYEVTERFSVGLGVPILHSLLELDIALPGNVGSGAKAELDGDDTQVGLNATVHYEVSDATRLGLMYQSAFDFEYGGDVDVKNFAGSPKLAIDTELTLAAIIKGSLSHDFSDSFTAHLTVGWEQWSDMDNVLLTGQNNSVALHKDWDDIWNFAVGMEYRLTPEWKINAGIRYDDNPTEARDRTADMPIDEQMRYALGVEYERREDLTIGAHMVYADYGDADIIAENSIDLPSPGPLPGDIEIPTGFTGNYSSNDLLFFSVSFNWKL